MTLILGLLLASGDADVPFDSNAHIAHLNETMRNKNYKDFGKLVFDPKSQSELRANIDWMKIQWFGGASAIVPMFYSKILWIMSAGHSPEKAVQLRGSAAGALLYTYAVTYIDGARCGDKSAPQHRRDQLMNFIPGFWATVKSYPLETRRMIVEMAVGMERHSAALRDARGDVEFLCANGMEEMTYNMKHGSTEEAPAQPGQIGRQMIVKGDGSYRPSIVDEKVWRPAASKARAELPAALAKLIMTDEEVGNLPPAP